MRTCARAATARAQGKNPRGACRPSTAKREALARAEIEAVRASDSKLDDATRAAIEEAARHSVRELVARLGDGTFVPPEYLTVHQVASLTGFSFKTLEFWRTRRDSGEPGEAGPPFVRISDRWIRYPLSDVRAWLAGLRVGEPQPEQPERAA